MDIMSACPWYPLSAGDFLWIFCFELVLKYLQNLLEKFSKLMVKVLSKTLHGF